MGPPKRHFAQRGEAEATGEEENVKRMKKSADSTPGGGTLTLEAQIMAELAQANALLAKEKQGKTQGASSGEMISGAGDAGISKPKSSKPSARAIKMDSEGNLIDEEGKLLESARPSSTSLKKKKNGSAVLPADKAKEKEVESNPYLAHLGSGPSQGRKGRGASRGARQPSKGLSFFKPGEYASSAAAKAAAIEKNTSSARQETYSVGGKSGLSLVPRATAAGGSGTASSGTASTTLRIEWWDKQYLPKDRQAGSKKDGDYVADAGNLQLSNSVAHKYVEHPVPVPSLSRLKAEQTLPMYLTKQERARIRKRKRAEAEQERRDKEAMGLLPPREPKLKLSNFMRVLGEKAVLDPSKMEMSVLQQIYQRQAAHELNNAKNKLTSEQRKEKSWLKRQEREAVTTAESLHVAVFTVGNIGDMGTRIKLLKNAQEWFLTGALVKCDEQQQRQQQGPRAPSPGVSGGCNLVIVEGGPRGIRKFSHMMLERVKWHKVASSSSSSAAAGSEEKGGGGGGGDGEASGGDKELVTMDACSDSDGDSDSDEDGDDGEGDSGNRCVLLWKGLASKRAFSRFQLHETRTLAGARHWLENNHVGHFYYQAMQQL